MEKLLSFLNTVPAFSGITQALEENKSAAITGIGQINRSHILSALASRLNRPLVILCQDDMSAKRLQQELEAFTAKSFPILPSRELTL